MKKIVIVDDINFQLLAVKERLKDKYEVYPAQNAAALFTLLDKIIPDMIILDINMRLCGI